MILNFFCNTCFHKTEKLIGLKSKPEKSYFCEKCNYPLTRTLNAFSSNFIEKIDNGNMEKAVEYDEKIAQEIKKNSRKLKTKQ